MLTCSHEYISYEFTVLNHSWFGPNQVEGRLIFYYQFEPVAVQSIIDSLTATEQVGLSVTETV